MSETVAQNVVKRLRNKFADDGTAGSYLPNEAADVVELLVAKVKELELAEEGAKMAFAHVVQQKRDLESKANRLQTLLDSAYDTIRRATK